jgi:hypothetical protein
MDIVQQIFANPVIQYGFAGLSLILLGFVVWLVKKIVRITEDCTRVMTNLLEKQSAQLTLLQDMIRLCRDIHDKLLARPCIAKREREG